MLLSHECLMGARMNAVFRNWRKELLATPAAGKHFPEYRSNLQMNGLSGSMHSNHAFDLQTTHLRAMVLELAVAELVELVELVLVELVEMLVVELAAVSRSRRKSMARASFVVAAAS